MKKKLIQAAIVVSPAVLLMPLFHYYMSIGESRTIGAPILVIALLGTAFVTLERFNRLCMTPPERRPIEIRRQKFAAELASATAVAGAAISLWMVFTNFDMQNTHAKYQRLANAQNQLENVLTLEFCQSKPYRQISCDGLRKGEQELFWLIIGGDNGKIAKKVQSLQFSLDGMAGEADLNVVAAAADAKIQLDRIVGLAESDRMMITTVMLTILLIAGCRAVSGKVAIAAFEYSDRPPASPAKPIILFEFLRNLKYQLFG